MAAQPRPVPQLYLVAPASGDTAGLASTLTELTGIADVAAVLLQLPEDTDRALKQYVTKLAPPVQNAGAALLIERRVDIALRVAADGAHLTGIEAFTAAVASLKPQSIAGAGGLISRHDAMLAGQADADYVMFGEPDAQGQRPSFDTVVERVAWWSEVFQPPCVGYAGELSEVRPLVAAGADFIAVGGFVFHSAQPSAMLKEVAAHLLCEEPAQ